MAIDINFSLLGSYFYAIFMCISTGAIGIFLLVVSYKHIFTDLDKVGLVKCSSFITGIIMITFVMSWIMFILVTVTNDITDKCSNTKKKKGSFGGVGWSNRTLIVVVGRISFTLLLLSCLSELTTVGFMWWTSFSLSSQYEVRDNCFCTRESKTNRWSVQDSLPDSFNVSCPQDDEVSCSSIFEEMIVHVSNLPVIIRKCQRLDLLEELDEDCLRFSEFWWIFKITRILLPILIVCKLPFLMLNCTPRSQQQSNKCQASSNSWLPSGQETVTSPLKLASPRIPTEAQTKKIKCSPYFGTRLAPLGEEKNGHFTETETTVRKKSVIGVLTGQALETPAPPRKVRIGSEADNYDDDCFVPGSPVVSDQNTISTPIQEGMKTPDFDLSKVIRPVYQNMSLNENELLHYLHPPPMSAPPVSTFRSTFPAVLREHLEKVDIAVPSPTKSDNRSVFVFTPSHHVYHHGEGNGQGTAQYSYKQMAPSTSGLSIKNIQESFHRSRSKSIATSTNWKRVV